MPDVFFRHRQTGAAFFFASYFFFFPAILVVLAALWYSDLASLWSVCAPLILYFLHLGVYRPQQHLGWSPWILLYSRVTDFVLHYTDGTCVREGGKIDPTKQKQHLFLLAAIHTVFTVYVVP